MFDKADAQGRAVTAAIRYAEAWQEFQWALDELEAANRQARADERTVR